LRGGSRAVSDDGQGYGTGSVASIGGGSVEGLFLSNVYTLRSFERVVN
jgi:hypothetical protein